MSILPHAQIHQLQLAVLHEINQLNKRQQGIIEMEVDVHLPSMSLPQSFCLQDICTVIHNHRASKVLICFQPKYTLDEEGRLELYNDLHKAAHLGSDCITSWGKGIYR
jgi:hypothetical protein